MAPTPRTPALQDRHQHYPRGPARRYGRVAVPRPATGRWSRQQPPTREFPRGGMRVGGPDRAGG